MSNLPTRDELMNAFRENRKVLIVYGSQNADVVAQYAELAQKMNGRIRNATIEIKPCSAVTSEDWQTKSIMLFGTLESNSLLRKMVENLPFGLEKANIQFDNKNYKDPSAVFLLSFYPNPLQPKLPVTVVAGTDDKALSNFLQFKMTEGWRLFGGGGFGYEIYQQNNRVVVGMFNAETWALDKKTHFDFTTSAQAIAETSNFRFIVPPNFDKTVLATYTKNVQETANRIRNFVDSTRTLSVINYHFYASAEEKGLMRNITKESDADFDKNEVHTVVNEIYNERQLGKENQVLLRNLLGKPKTDAVERGLAIYFTQNWQRKGYEYWALKLFKSDNITSLTEMLNNVMLEKESGLIIDCLSASFVAFLIQKQGKDIFLKNYPTWSPPNTEIPQLEKEWHQWLSQKTKNFKPETRNPTQLPYLKGFNFAHEGYAIFNGYVSKMATQSLDKQANELYCNATAIVPYSFMENPNKPTVIPIEHGSGGENDESVIHSANSAQKLGMTVILKPQIWMGRGAWPGDVEMKSEADWQQFFENYYKWIRHYALLAEMYDIEMLCIGTEFAKTTLAREQDWRKLIQKIRGIYGGKITYAANWGAEFEGIQFWDELDVIGLDCYYPLSANANATEQELREGFDKILNKMEKIVQKHNKPFIFTEIGFKSVKTPWLMPHAASDNTPYFGTHQALCYKIVLESIHKKSWIDGILWWKFPSYIEHRGIENDDFTPNRKPAEAVVKEWFSKK